jgi:hypothetical protein
MVLRLAVTKTSAERRPMALSRWKLAAMMATILLDQDWLLERLVVICPCSVA